MASTELFNKYRRDDSKYRILLLYLILNKYDLSLVEKAVETVQSKALGMEFRKIFGVTSEFVDIKRIEAEIAEICVPVICSLQSYELYSNAETIYTYAPKEESKPLYINDMGIISPLMVITESCIVSSNLAKPVEATENCGFMYFAEYILKGKTTVGDWEISYQNKDFKVCYCTEIEENGTKRIHKEPLYQAIELDQTATLKLVLYIIKKAANSDSIEELIPDNYTYETWKLDKK